MLIVLSPAKSLDYSSPIPDVASIPVDVPAFMPQAAKLIGLLKKKSAPELMEMMAISEPLAQLNKQRYRDWLRQPDPAQGRAAIFAFNGDVYEGLDACTLKSGQFDYLQQHLRILSGLYGVLCPFDLLQAYRLEMGTRLANLQGSNLYAFWGDTIAASLRTELEAHSSGVVVNLASEEYFKAVKSGLQSATVITPVFEDWKTDRYKVISFYAKRARGLMARYCAQHSVTNPEKLKKFTVDGYHFVADQSDAVHWVFRRRVD